MQFAQGEKLGEEKSTAVHLHYTLCTVITHRLISYKFTLFVQSNDSSRGDCISTEQLSGKAEGDGPGCLAGGGVEATVSYCWHS